MSSGDWAVWRELPDAQSPAKPYRDDLHRYRQCADDGVPSFVDVVAPADDELYELLQTLIAFGPRAGHKLLTLRGSAPREVSPRQRLCADIEGFGLYAGVRVDTHERQRLEQLCRYIKRPALSDRRVQLNATGQIELKLKTAWRDGTTHLVMSPLEFMQRLAALVPRPRLHPVRYHGALAQNARLRARVVPQDPTPADKVAAAQGAGARGRPTTQHDALGAH